MHIRRHLTLAVIAVALLGAASTVRAQSSSRADEKPFYIDLGVGFAPTINGNVNSGAIGTFRGFTTVFLPNSYGDVYGAGIDFRFGGAYRLNEASEVRGMFIYQSGDADLVRLGDIGPSPLYGQYSDYKSWGLDVGYRRYFTHFEGARVYGEATIGIADVQRINVQMAAPAANISFDNTDFYDGTAAFTWAINGGFLFPISEQLDFNAQLGIRHVGGLATPDALKGTTLDEITNDTARLSFPIVVGVRLHIK